MYRLTVYHHKYYLYAYITIGVDVRDERYGDVEDCLESGVEMVDTDSEDITCAINGVGIEGENEGPNEQNLEDRVDEEELDTEEAVEEAIELDTEEEVEEAMSRIILGEDVPIELRPCDIDEDRLVEEFMSKECGCLKNEGKAYSTRFSVSYVKERRLSFKCLTKEQLDMLLLGQLIAPTDTDTTTSGKNRNKSGERQKLYTSHFHCGQAICRKMFMFIHGVSKKRLYNIACSFHKHGIAPRVHGNTKHLPVNTLSLQSVDNVVRFLLNYVEKHGLLLPGRIPGYSRSDIKLLPSSTSKRSIWKLYFDSTQEEPSLHAVAYSTFCKLWQFQLPQIKLMKPITDLCWTCQQNSSALLKCANSPEKQKSETVQNALEHLRIVQCERSYYKTTCDNCRRDVENFFTESNTFQPPPLASHTPANSRSIKAHYSFDYAQQIHYPSDPMQPGPIYFMTPRKCSIFTLTAKRCHAR